MTGPALDLLNLLRLDTGNRWGDVATPDQRSDAERVLDPLCETPYLYFTRARGYSKTTDLAAIALCLMPTLPRGSRAYAVAADRAQARLLLHAMKAFLRRTPGLAREFKTGAWEITFRKTGTVLEILAADGPSAWGLLGALFIIDELAAHPDTPSAHEVWEAVSTAAAKNPRAKMVCLTTAGSPSHPAFKVLQHALVDPMWYVHEIAGPAPWMSTDRLAEARRRLSESAYARLFENRWTEPEGTLAALADLQACAVLADWPLPPRPGVRYAIGVDIGVYGDPTAVAIAHSEPAPDEEGSVRVVLDRMGWWPAGHGENQVKLRVVGDWILEMARLYNGAKVVYDESQFIEGRQRLDEHSVTTEKFVFSASSVGKLASILHQLIRGRRLRLPVDDALLDELGAVRLVETAPGVYRMDHDRNRHDDRAIALSLAAQELIARSEPFDSAAALSFGNTNAFELSAPSGWDVGGTGFDWGRGDVVGPS